MEATRRTNSKRAHENWEANRAYWETFGDSSPIFPWWRGTPRRCKCGCQSIWFDRLSSANFWNWFSLNLLIESSFLVPVFRALFDVIWSLPAAMWVFLILWRNEYFNSVAANRSDYKTIAMGTARIVFYGFIAPISVALVAGIWVFSRFGGFIFTALWLLALLLLIALVLVIFLLGIVGIALKGLIFVVGGLVSVVYTDYPMIGVGLIVLGIALQYEFNRRAEKQLHERIGSLIMMLKETHESKSEANRISESSQ